MKIAIPYALLGIGALLLVASTAWPSLFPATNYWSQADEEQLEAIQSKVHNLSYLAAEAERSPDPRRNKMSGEKMMEYRRLKSEAQALLDRRDDAIERPGYISSLLRYTGIAGLLLGIGGYYIVRETE